MGPFLDRVRAAQYLTEKKGLKTSPKTLQKKASTGGGPKYRIYGRLAVYEPQHLDEYADAELSDLRGSTSEIPAKAG